MPAELILEIVEGPQAGRQIPLSSQVQLGRGSAAGHEIDDPLVSRRHASVSVDGDRAQVEDLESRNGTFVNGEQIHGPTTLVPGDQLLVGVTLLELRTREQVAERSSAVHQIPEAFTSLSASPPRPSDPPPPGGRDAESPLDDYLDVRVKKQASAAPLAIFLLVAIIVSVYLATR